MNRQQKRMAGIVLLAVALIALWNQRSQKPPETPTTSPSAAASVAAPVEVQNALFARRKIEKNTKFDEMKILELVELKKDIPKDQLPKEGVVSRFEELKGRIALEDIQKGEVIIASRFATPGEIGGVSYHIPDGFRAVTLRIDKVKGVGGFIQQGDFVDILGSFSMDGKVLTKSVLQKVKILAVNQIFIAAGPGPEGGPRASPAASPAPGPTPPPDPNAPPKDRITGGDVQLVTFEVRPDDAERLVVASENAHLYLILRNPNDPDLTPPEPVDAVDVYVERPKKRPVPKYDVDMLKGGTRSAVGVRVESVEGQDLTTGLKKSVYLDPREPTVRDLSPQDFRTGGR
jgi:Flp pilus assembly protein CpaB